jgi:manganese/iron transport system permease protein
VSLILDPLAHEFMWRALIVAVVVGAACAVLSCFLVLKGWSLMGDAVSHAVLPGIVLAFLGGVPLKLGALAAGLGCALATGWPRASNTMLRELLVPWSRARSAPWRRCRRAG